MILDGLLLFFSPEFNIVSFLLIYRVYCTPYFLGTYRLVPAPIY